MLRIGSITLAPEREPPRPTIRPYWPVQTMREDARLGESAGIPWASGSLRIERAYHPPIGLQPPNLQDYLDECGETEDGCGRTFETMDGGTLTWTEKAHEGSRYTEIEHSMTKAGGRVVAEGHVKSYPVSWDGRSESWNMAPMEWANTSHAYYPCANAIKRSVETVYTVYMTASMVLAGVTPQPGQLGTMLYSQKAVEQFYQAEGWLRSRLETTTQFDRWLEYESGGVITRVAAYKTSVRNEVYTPIGGGIWSVHVSTSERVMVPIIEMVEEPAEEEGEASTWVEEIVGHRYVTRATQFTQMTDAPPPTVTIDEGSNTCEDRAQERYQEALDRYNEQLGIITAQRVNTPERMIVATFTTDRPQRRLRLGDQITTPVGGGIITRIGWSGSRPPTGSPSMSISVEVRAKG